MTEKGGTLQNEIEHDEIEHDGNRTFVSRVRVVPHEETPNPEKSPLKLQPTIA